MPAIRMPESWDGTISTQLGKTVTTSRRGASRPDTAARPDPSPRRTRSPAEAGRADDPADDATRGSVAGQAPGATGRGHGSRARLTGRGGVFTVFALSFTGVIAADASHVGPLAGSSYVAACMLAALAVRRNQLLPVVVTLPVLLAAAVVCAQALTTGGGALAITEGTLVSLGNMAPWLFAGTALGTLAATTRGLASNIRTLRESLSVGSRVENPRVARRGQPWQ